MLCVSRVCGLIIRVARAEAFLGHVQRGSFCDGDEFGLENQRHPLLELT